MGATKETEPSRMMVMGVSAALAAALLATGFCWMSPYMAARELREALGEGDAKALSEMVDFESVKKGLKAQVRERAGRAAAGSALSQVPFAAELFKKAAGGLADVAIDEAVSPEGLVDILGPAIGKRRPVSMAKGGGKKEPETAAKKDPEPKYEAGYKGWGRFEMKVGSKMADGPDRRVGLGFARDGLFSWKLVELSLPESWMGPR